MRHLAAWRLVVPVAAVLAVVGCTEGPDPEPTATAVEVGDVADPVWQVRAEAMSQPHVKDGVAVAYLAVPDADASVPEVGPYDTPVVPDVLTVVAWDAETGDELWRHAAVSGSSVSTDADDYGYGPSVAVTELDGAQVVHYLVGDPDSDGTQVATADLRTGTETRYGPAVWATSRPHSCESDPRRGVCLTGTFAGETDAHDIQTRCRPVPNGSAPVCSPSKGSWGTPTRLVKFSGLVRTRTCSCPVPPPRGSPGGYHATTTVCWWGWGRYRPR